MKKELVRLYNQFRKAKPFMLVGRDAECSLRSAKTLLRFRELESDGLVRMRAEPEQESYLDVYGEPEGYERRGHWVPGFVEKAELMATLDRLGCWWTCSEYFDGEDWQQADSCGMHTGYNDPLDPFENCYVIDEMAEAIRQWELHHESETLEQSVQSGLEPCPVI